MQQAQSNNPANSTSPTNPTVRLEPISESVIVPQPWYRRIFGPVTRTDTVWKLSVVALWIVGVFIGNSMKNPQTTVTKAAAGNAKVSIYPHESKLPLEKSFQLWITTDQPVSSADITLTFDPKAIQISREVIPGVNTSYSVQFTSWTQANKTGALEFHVKPGTTNNPIAPGTMQFGTFYFNKTKGTSSTFTTIAVNTEKTTVANQDSIPFTVSTTDTSITLSP